MQYLIGGTTGHISSQDFLAFKKRRKSSILVFFQSLLDDGHPLLMRLSGRVPLERTQLLRSKARNPHVPVPLKNNLNIPYINIVCLPVLGKGTGLAHSVLNEVISNLQKDVFYILIQLFSRINFLDQLTQPFLVQNLSF